VSDKVFYSWQSDLPNRTNRGLIESALNRAARNLRSDESIRVEPVIERDTVGVPGAPDIAATILHKIDEASAFVCDVSIVSRQEGGRAFPNPNVLLELGYALKSLKSGRLVLVFNKAFGDVSELPFDLRFKRVLTYHMSQNMEPGEVRRALASDLAKALKAIFEHIERASKNENNSSYLTKLNEILTDVILFGEESRDRRIDPWARELIDEFESAASLLRKLAADEVTKELRILDDLETLADDLSEVVGYVKAFGRESHNRFNELVDIAVKKAWKLKKSHIDSVPVGRAFKGKLIHQVGQLLETLGLWIDRWERADGDKRHKLIDDFLSEVSDVGQRLLMLSYYKVDGISPDLLKLLREVARPVHLIGYFYQTSGRNRQKVIEDAKERRSSLTSAFEGLS